MKERWKGIFFLDEDRKMPGEIKVNQNKGTSKLTLWNVGDIDDFRDELVPYTLHGVVLGSRGNKFASLYGCLFRHKTFGFPASICQIDISFSHVAFGLAKLDQEEPSITSVQFLFNGFEKSNPISGGFRSVTRPDKKLRSEIERNIGSSPSNPFKLGKSPVIGIFDGAESDLTISETVLGSIEINARSVTIPSGNPLIKNGPFIKLKFNQPISLSEAYRRLSIIRNFIGLIIGSVPRITAFSAVSKEGYETPLNFDVLTPTDRLDLIRTRKTSIFMSLLDHISRKEEFISVTKTWLSRNENSHRNDGNTRFLQHFGKMNYNEDRLIGAVNMFDLLPPSEKKYSGGKKINSVAKLIMKKAEPILETVGKNKLQNLDLVIQFAVDCRNHYVHGKTTEMNYRTGGTIIFLTQSIEFIYGVSELLECGWDIRSWLDNGHWSRHPFGYFLQNYDNSLQELQKQGFDLHASV